MKHTVDFTEKTIKELQVLGKTATDKVLQNFVRPIRNGFTPPDELQGKYKPNWEMPFIDSPMKQAFVDAAKKYNLHHYHFGYLFYKDGKDPVYPGDVSDGIIHTRSEVEERMTTHVIFQVCLEHPSPFTYQLDRALDKGVGNKAA